MYDHGTIKLTDFNGLFDRGDDEEVPPDHLSEAYNVQFSVRGVRTRQGTTNSVEFPYGQIKRFYLFRSETYGNRALILNERGDLYDLSNGVYTHLLSIPDMIDFSVESSINRIYISPHNRQHGLPGEFVYIWDGINIRTAAGNGPHTDVSMTANVSGTVLNEVQQIDTENVTGGTFTLTFKGNTTGALSFNATALQVQTALEGLAGIGAGNVSVSKTDVGFINVVYWTVTFGGTLSGKDVSSITIDSTNLTSTSGDVFADVFETVRGGGTGKVSAGSRKFAVAYETDTGYITKYGPIKSDGTFNPTIYYSPMDDRKVQLSAIPIGPSYVKARHILATKAEGEEFFFVPNGRIPDNTTTTKIVDFSDEELIESADFLADLLENIPAALGMLQYSDRLCLWGFPTPEEHVLRASVAMQWEQFNATDNAKLINPNDRYNIKAACELREILYIFKTIGCFSVFDNGQEPVDWERAKEVDAAVGCEVYGISVIPNAKPAATRERYLVATRGGLLLFNGVFSDTPITWKVDAVWKRINKDEFDRIQVIDDPSTKSIYINLPLDSSSVPNVVLYGDYTQGLTPDKVKWSIWTFPNNPEVINAFDLNDQGIVFRYASSDINAIQRGCGVTKNDGVYPIDSNIRTWVSALGDEMNNNLFYEAKFRVNGAGELLLTCYGEDLSNPKTPLPLDLTASPGRELRRILRYRNERMSMRIRTNAVDNWFYLGQINIYSTDHEHKRASAHD